MKAYSSMVKSRSVYVTFWETIQWSSWRCGEERLTCQIVYGDHSTTGRKVIIAGDTYSVPMWIVTFTPRLTLKSDVKQIPRDKYWFRMCPVPPTHLVHHMILVLCIDNRWNDCKFIQLSNKSQSSHFRVNLMHLRLAWNESQGGESPGRVLLGLQLTEEVLRSRIRGSVHSSTAD